MNQELNDIPRTLLVSTRRGVCRAVRRSLVSVGWRVTNCDFDAQEIAALANDSTQRDLVIIDADGDKTEVVRALHSLESAKATVLLLSCTLEDKTLIEHMLGNGFSNVIAKHTGLAANQEHIDETELIITCEKLITKEIFGLDRYLPTRSVRVHSCPIRRSDERAPALRALDGFLEEIDCYQQIRPMILAVADELLMNAIFSAPRTPDGKPKYDERDRRDSFALEEKETVDFSYACDGKSVLMSVSDQFGSLDRDMIMRYLGRGLMGAKGEVEEKKGGAGLGLYMVVHSITNLVFNVHANRRTEVIAGFYVRSGLRAFRVSGQSLNLFLLR